MRDFTTNFGVTMEVYPLEKGVAVGVLIDAKTEKFVLVRNIAYSGQYGPRWKLPGGTIEVLKHETPTQAIKREILEETGLVTGYLEYITRYTNRHNPFFLFLCIVEGLDFLHKKPISDGKDILETGVFTLQEILNMNDMIRGCRKMVPVHYRMFCLVHVHLEWMSKNAVATS